MLLFVDDDLGTLDVDDGTAYVTESVQLPLPAVREVSDNRPEMDGTIDQTRYVGARAVTASIVCFAEPGVPVQQRVDALRRYLRPSLRFAVVWRPVGTSDTRRMIVRAATHDVVLSDARFARTTLSLVAPSGLVESELLHSVTLAPSGTGPELGRVYDEVYDKTYAGSTTAPAETVIVNAGSADARWTARLYGSCTSPRLENRTTGEVLRLNGYVVPQGSYVEVDAARRTLLLDSNPTLSVYSYLDLTVSSWWRLVPGENRLAYTPASVGAGAEAVVEWRDSWL